MSDVFQQVAQEPAADLLPFAAPSVIAIPVKTLLERTHNARTHSDKQVSQIAASIRAFGFVNPVLIDAQGCLIAGHGRVRAAKQLKMETVPAITISHLSEEQLRAYVLADNRLAELAGWDPEILKIEFQFLQAADLTFDLGVTGFDTAQVDLLLDAPTKAKDALDNEVPPRSDSIVSRPGDIWHLGRHRLMCSDARDEASYTALLAGQKADLIFADPPYNVVIDGNVCGKGQIKHAEFAMASGEMSSAEFATFLGAVFQQLISHSKDGSIHFVCMDWRHAGEIVEAGKAYREWKNLIVWNKDNAGMGTFYRSKHELIFVFKNGTAAHVNNFGLGEKGRYRTNVWNYAGITSNSATRLDELAMHPTVKPVALVADALRDCSKRKGIVLDPFCGSGTTLIAAQKTGRVAYAMELDPAGRRHPFAARHLWRERRFQGGSSIL